MTRNSALTWQFKRSEQERRRVFSQIRVPLIRPAIEASLHTVRALQT